ncbi:MAG: protein phosphatase 2C domain-containing protein, partial [Solirubrobacteraceae bacterium]
VDPDALAVAHVGDSRAYIFRDGELARLTEDHSLVGELVRQGKLTEEQAEEHPQRSIITRALGIEADVEVDTWSYPGRAGDVVLLCSDGLTSMVSEDEVAAVLAAEADLDRAAQRLIDAANDNGGRDNITVVLFRLEDVGGEAESHQPTTIVAPAPSGDGGTEADAQSDGVRVATAPPPSLRAAPQRPGPRLARTQGRRPDEPSPGGRRRRSERWIKTVSALTAIVIVLFLVGGGAYLASREYFFIGTNSSGIVTIFRGFPYDLPFGIHMYEQFYVSGVPLSAIPADRRAHLLNHQLRSQGGAISLVHAAELGQLQGAG